MQLKCFSGEDEGEEVIYKPSSVGGANVMQKLLDELEKQLDAGTDEIVPVVELTTDNYQHKQYGKTYVPQFDIVEWVTMDGPVEGDDEPAPAPEEKPAKKSGKRRLKNSRTRNQKTTWTTARTLKTRLKLKNRRPKGAHVAVAGLPNRNRRTGGTRFGTASQVTHGVQTD